MLTLDLYHDMTDMVRMHYVDRIYDIVPELDR